MARLAKGDAAPDFHLTDQNGNGWGLGDFEGKFLVFFFYKGDGTKYCTMQVEAFRDLHEEFTRLGAKVVGVSGDDADSHRGFAAQCRLPFNLLVDTDHEVARLFGIAQAEPDDPVSPVSRDTYLIGPDGTVLNVFEDVRDTGGHAGAVLEDLKRHVRVPAEK